MHRLAECMVEYLVINEIVQEKDREIYTYGLEVFGLKCVNYGTIILLSYIFDDFVPTIFFMICFLSLRGRTGGFHLKSAISCYIGTVGIYVLTSKLLVLVLLDNQILILGVAIIAGIAIWIIAPLNHNNLELDEKELSECKQATRILLIFIAGCMYIASFSGINTVCIAYAVSGIALDAVLLIIQKIKEGSSI